MLLKGGGVYVEKELIEKGYVDYCNVMEVLGKNVEGGVFGGYIYMEGGEYKEGGVD